MSWDCVAIRGALTHKYTKNHVLYTRLAAAHAGIIEGTTRSTDRVSHRATVFGVFAYCAKDLLTPAQEFRDKTAPALNIREDPEVGFFVEGLREHRVDSHQKV